MKKTFSKSWKASKQPRKQRKYRFHAPLHIRGESLNAHIAKELAVKHGIKRIRVRAGDKVKVMRGKFKGKEDKIDFVETKTGRVYVVGVERTKKDGSKAKISVHASNILITDLNLDDKTRLPKKEEKKTENKTEKKTNKTQAESVASAGKEQNQ
jgi:large subunit ribosomal protein L24